MKLLPYKATPTLEQEAVIHHPLGRHAKVLAVAGSGKTETLALRVAYLAADKKVAEDQICVLMFNKLARAQFKERLEKLGVKPGYVSRVHTFHSFCYGFINRMIREGLLPTPPVMWINDRAEESRIHAHRAIQALEARGEIIPNLVDVDVFMRAMSKWKGALITPDRAGFHGNPHVEKVYAEYEKLRIERNALAFDDFVPLVVGLLESEPTILARLSKSTDHLIIDECQDLNLGQQRLIQHLAGSRADLMICGDDDQTIFEWRDASPDFIIDGFERMFPGKPTTVYRLSHSFRFGPLIAQAAHNVLSNNQRRVPKNLVPFNKGLPSSINVFETHSGQPTDVDVALVNHLVDCVKECGDPRKVVVLGRTFAQFLGLEAQLLARRIPYRVIGRAPFFERREISVLLDYAKAGLSLDATMDRKLSAIYQSIVNTPNRMIRRELLDHELEWARKERITARVMLGGMISDRLSHFPYNVRQNIAGLVDTLLRIEELVVHEPGITAGDFFQWLSEGLDFERHYKNYFGAGLDSFERMNAMRSFIETYARPSGLSVPKFLALVDRLDTTHGRPVNEQIVMTTAYRAKGLEYDHVIIPCCSEGYMPCFKGAENPAFDKSGRTVTPPPSSVIETERRLFGVAVTRARKSVAIGVSVPPDSGSRADSNPSLPSRFIDELRVDETRPLMELVEDVARGLPDPTEQFVELIRSHGRIPTLWANVRDGYLAGRMPTKRFEALDMTVESVPERMLTYQYPYSGTDPDAVVPVVDDEDEAEDGLKWWERAA